MLLMDTVQWLVLLQTCCMGDILLFHWLTLSLVFDHIWHAL